MDNLKVFFLIWDLFSELAVSFWWGICLDPGNRGACRSLGHILKFVAFLFKTIAYNGPYQHDTDSEFFQNWYFQVEEYWPTILSEVTAHLNASGKIYGLIYF